MRYGAVLSGDIDQSQSIVFERLRLLGLTVGPPRRHRQIHLSSTNHSTSARRAERYARADLADELTGIAARGTLETSLKTLLDGIGSRSGHAAAGSHPDIG
jgi:hypothetical protein